MCTVALHRNRDRRDLRPVDPLDAAPGSFTGRPPGARDVPWSPLLRVLWALLALFVVVGPVVGIVNDAFPDRGGPVRGAFTVVGRITSLGNETSVPTWFAVSLLLALAATFAVVATTQRARGRSPLPHLVFAAVALFLSADESAALHEELGRITVQFVDRDALLTFTWIIPGVVLTLLVGVGLLRLARAVPRTLRTRLVVAGVVFLLGAVVFEGVSGLVVTSPTGPCLTIEACVVRQTPLYRVLNAIEEGLEMAGVLLALRAALLCLVLRRTADGLAVVAAPQQGASAEDPPSTTVDGV